MRVRSQSRIGVLFLVSWLSSCSQTAERVLGGPCEGCDLVFVGIPSVLQPSARIAPEGENGDPLVLEGTVRNQNGSPVEGVIVYAYHTDASGIYPRSTTLHGRLRGWTRTDPRGHYRFETIRPGAYPHRTDPQHIHMHIIESGLGTYYIDEVVFDDDPLLTSWQLERRPNRGGSGVCHPERDAEGIWHVRRDIMLGEGLPGYHR